MKLSKAFAFSFLVLLALSGCNRLPSFKDRVVNVNKNITKMSGVIEAKELDLYKLGTHQIKTSQGDTFPIQSKTINLSNYLGKQVSIHGSLEVSPIDKTKTVFTVDKIALAGEEFDKKQSYSSQAFGLKFSYPGNWELMESGDSLVFKTNGKKQVRIDIFPSSGTVDEFVKIAEDGGKGTPVTVGAQRSLRFTDEGVRVYVPNYSKKKVYLISFDRTEGSEAEKQFYSLLESFSIIQTKRQTGARCAGAAQLECQEGFQCELNSTEKDSAGVCVDVSASNKKPDCPFVQTPENCTVYKVKSVSKDECPTSYVCMDDPKNSSEIKTESTTTIDKTERIKATFTKYQSKILGDFGAKVNSIQVDEKRQQITVTFTDEKGDHTVIYSYSPSGNEFNFIEKSRTDGIEKPTDEIIKPNKTTAEKIISTKEVPDPDFRLYENSYYNFSALYFKNWYYQSFGAEGDHILVVGFAENELATIDDSLVTLGIDEGAVSAESTESGVVSYKVIIPRDDKSHFFITGPTTLKDVLNKMADSITLN